MRVRVAFILLSSVLLSLHRVQADPVVYNFTDIKVPGGIEVQATGINNNEQIVGTNYTLPDFSIHGFIDKNRQITSFDVPGPINAINDHGQVVGYYSTGNLNSTHGFLDTNGTITSFDVPGSSSVQFTGINNAGQIVGSAQIYLTAGGIQEFGFLYANGVVTTIQVPGSTSAHTSGINNGGQIVGYFSSEATIFPATAVRDF